MALSISIGIVLRVIYWIIDGDFYWESILCFCGDFYWESIFGFCEFQACIKLIHWFPLQILYVEDTARIGAIKFFRTQSPRHFEGGDWDQGGSCPRHEPLTTEQVHYILLFHLTLLLIIFWAELEPSMKKHVVPLEEWFFTPCCCYLDYFPTSIVKWAAV